MRLGQRDTLVVGTDPVTLAGLRAALQTLCAFRIAATPALARQALAARTPHLLLVDASLDPSGLDLVAELRTKSIAPAVVVAEHGQEELAVRALELRANAYLRKPLRPEMLRVQIASLLAEGPRPDHLAEHAQAVMRRMADQAPSLEELSAQFGLPPRRLRRLFVDRFGRTPTEYVRELRIQEAQRLLLTTGLPVQAIGKRLGFATAPHFDRTFKLQVGMTPLQFRHEHRIAPEGLPVLTDAPPVQRAAANPA
jgi:AraC-like DNA-binding protein